jgi:hypothetical protein
VLSAAPPWKRQLLAVHVEELEHLWNQRLHAWDAGDWPQPAVARLDGRIAAHADALVLAGEEAMLPLEEALGSEEFPAVVGAAHVLLSRQDRDGVARARALLLASRGLLAEALRIAIRHAPVTAHVEALGLAAREPDEGRAVAALSALAFHGGDGDLGRLVALVQSCDAAVRAQAWEAVAYLGAEHLAASPAANLRAALSERFRAGLRDPAGSVKAALLDAAAWTRQRWLLDHLRSVAASAALRPDDLPALRLLAVLGEAQDLPALLAAAANPALEPARVELLGILGQPDGMEDLLAALDSEEPDLAWAAARAFRHWTGIELPSLSAEVLGVTDPDGMDSRGLPDAAPARAWWERQRARGAASLPEPDHNSLVLSARIARALRSGGQRKAELERLSGDA